MSDSSPPPVSSRDGPSAPGARRGVSPSPSVYTVSPSCIFSRFLVTQEASADVGADQAAGKVGPRSLPRRNRGLCPYGGPASPSPTPKYIYISLYNYESKHSWSGVASTPPSPPCLPVSRAVTETRDAPGWRCPRPSLPPHCHCSVPSCTVCRPGASKASPDGAHALTAPLQHGLLITA